jgi:hypothetical protein
METLEDGIHCGRLLAGGCGGRRRPPSRRSSGCAVRDHRQRHAVHRAARRHAEHDALVVLAGDACDVPVHLDHLRRLHAARHDAVEDKLRGLADAEHAHPGVRRADLREHERGAAKAVDDVTLAELA